MFDLLAPAPWMRDAACLEHPTIADAWFPPRGTTAAAAKAVCAACLVRGDCLTFALEQRIDEGVWGGLGPIERQKIRKSEKVVASV